MEKRIDLCERRIDSRHMQTPTNPGWTGDDPQRRPAAPGPAPVGPGWGGPPQPDWGAPPPGIAGPYGAAPIVAPDPYRPGAPRPPLASGPGGRAVDGVLAATAHASILFGLLGVGLLLTLLIDAGIWIYSRRSPYVAFHARQALYYHGFLFLFNLAYLCGLFVLFGFYMAYPHWEFVGNLGLAFVFPGIVWFVGTILYGLVGAVLVLLGRPFAYPIFGRWAARRLPGAPGRPPGPGR